MEESYSFFRDNIEFTLTRLYRLPVEAPPPQQQQQQQGGGGTGDLHGGVQPLARLPTLDEALRRPLDSLVPGGGNGGAEDGRWTLHVCAYATEEGAGQPEQMRLGHDLLADVRAELDDLFHFLPAVDRRAFDTRLAPQPAGLPPPQAQPAVSGVKGPVGAGVG